MPRAHLFSAEPVSLRLIMDPRDGVSHTAPSQPLGNIYVSCPPSVADEDQMASDFVRIYTRIPHLFA